MWCEDGKAGFCSHPVTKRKASLRVRPTKQKREQRCLGFGGHSCTAKLNSRTLDPAFSSDVNEQAPFLCELASVGCSIICNQQHPNCGMLTVSDTKLHLLAKSQWL